MPFGSRPTRDTSNWGGTCRADCLCHQCLSAVVPLGTQLWLISLPLHLGGHQCLSAVVPLGTQSYEKRPRIAVGTVTNAFRQSSHSGRAFVVAPPKAKAASPMPFGSRPTRDIRLHKLDSLRFLSPMPFGSRPTRDRTTLKQSAGQLTRSPMPFGSRPTRDTIQYLHNSIYRVMSPMPFGSRPTRDADGRRGSYQNGATSPMPFGSRPTRDWKM